MAKFKNFVWGIGLCFFVLMPLARGQEGPGPADGHPGGHIQEIFRQLDLTADQKRQLEVNKQQHRARMERARQEIKVIKDQLQEELMKSQLDMPRIHELHERIKALMSQMEDIKLSSILAVRSILTPQQFSKFVNLMHKHKEHSK